MQPKFKLRRYQYTLRTLLLLLTLTCLLLAAWKTAIAPYGRQYEVLQRLSAIQGQPGETMTSGPFGPEFQAEPALPEWLRWTPGSDRLVKVTSVKLDHCVAGDEDLECLRDLGDLERLYLPCTNITDKTLEAIGGLTRLKRLSLWRTKITDRGVKCLGRLVHLEALDIQETGVTEAVLEDLEKLPRLAVFRHEIALGDDGLERLDRFPQLQAGGVVRLRLKRVTDRGMEHISRFRGADSLFAVQCRIGANWRRLAEVPSIRHVEIAEMDVGPDALAALANLPTLESLTIDRAQFTGGWQHLAELRALTMLQSTQTAWPPGSLEALSQCPARGCLFANCPGVTVGAIGRAWRRHGGRIEIWEDHVVMIGDGPEVNAAGPVPAADFAGLEELSNLADLTIVHKDLEAALVHLQRLPRLTRLSLGGPISDDALAQISRIRGLRYLSINNADSRDVPGPSLAGLRHLASLPELTELWCSCGLTDDKLDFVRDMPRLRKLSLMDQGLTDAGLAPLTELSQLDELSAWGPYSVLHLIKRDRRRAGTTAGDAGAP
jgi:hypothetical protein